MNIKSSDEHMVPIEDLVNPRAIDYHAETGHIYFADTTSFLIGRQKIDGSSRETILKDGGCKISILMKCNFYPYIKIVLLFIFFRKVYWMTIMYLNCDNSVVLILL